MGKIYGKVEVKRRKRRKKVDEHRRHRDIFLNFRMTQKEKDLIEARIATTGMAKATFFIESCLYQKILVKGNIKSFTAIRDTLRNLSEKIDKKGLVAAFKEFLKPKPIIKPPKEEPRRERPHKVIPDAKKRHSPAR